MTVWVVCWLQSHEGPVFERVFSSELKARTWVAGEGSRTEWYSVEEIEVE